MGNILRYFLDKYGRLYDKKARFLSEPSLLLQKLPMGSLRREQRVTVFPWRLLRKPHSTASPKQSLLGRTLVKEPWLRTASPFHFSPRHASLPLSARSACSCHFTHKAAT